MTANRRRDGGVLRIVVLFAAIAAAGCGREAPSNSPPPQVTSRNDGPRPVGSEDEALVAVSAAIRRTKLVTQPDECLAYSVAQHDADTYEVQVRENHRRTECGGDPQTSPRLFEVRVSRKTGEMTTNAGRDVIDFQPLKE